MTKAITEFAISKLLDTQLEKFDLKSIHSERVMAFDPEHALSALHAQEGRSVIGADFGGDKGVTRLFTVQNGHLMPNDGYNDYVQGTDGDGYLESFEKTAAYAKEHDIPVGLAWGAPLNGTKPLYHPKMKNFLAALDAKYDGDFAGVFSTLRLCINDGPAGLISGAIEANRTHSAKSILFPINGGGYGMAALVNGIIYSTEGGHVEAVPELNTYHQTTPCGVYDAGYVCIENIGSSKGGVEAQWKLLTGESLRAIDIEGRYKAGDTLAAELYEHSALVTAHLILGTANAYDIDLSDASSVIVGHGGAFKFPHYGERVQQILAGSIKSTPQLIMTKDYGDPTSNACLDGAAYGAILAEN